MTPPACIIDDYGDAAMLVTLGATADDAILMRVHDLAARVRRERGSGVPFGVPVPGLTTLMAPYDPRNLTPDDARARLADLVAQLDDAQRPAPAGAPGRTVEIQVRYGGADGPDLEEVAARCGLTPGQVVDAHASTLYRVLMLGFVPGFGYLGELPEELVSPRRDIPRQRVPAGSVAIAGRRTAVYPFETPGGWQLIGRTDAVLWDAYRQPPTLLRPGDSVRFSPVTGG